jgi:RNA polymerase sigma-70 factor (ECF subfamily)
MIDLESVIEGCRKNNKKAQKELFDAYASILLGVCMRYSRDKAEAEDIFQEGFLKILLNIQEFSGSGQFVNWMRKVMVNTAITHYNRNKKYYNHSELNDVKDNIKNEISADSDYAAEELNKLIQTMPAGYRMVFNLFAIEGYKHKEIAEIMGIDEDTSKTQFLRAKNWLQKELKKLDNI